MKTLPQFLTTAWDWSERNDIPVELWRGDDGDWALSLRLKDARGWFSGTVYVFPQNKARSQTVNYSARPAESADHNRQTFRNDPPGFSPAHKRLDAIAAASERDRQQRRVLEAMEADLIAFAKAGAPKSGDE